MKRTLGVVTLALAFVFIGDSGVSGHEHDAWTGTYRVTVTNLTSGQHFTPILAATHGEDVSIFTAGTAASDELKALAEGGDTMPLAMALRGKAMSIETTEGLLAPGATVELLVNGGSMHRYLSLAAMLIPTNDGFAGFRVMLSSEPRVRTYNVNAYDAGTEVNDEKCESIPGPHMECMRPGGGGAPGMGEGVVTIHRGIQGGGDFEGDRDWRNPVARVTIRRVS